jgi:hypothetical protein
LAPPVSAGVFPGTIEGRTSNGTLIAGALAISVVSERPSISGNAAPAIKSNSVDTMPPAFGSLSFSPTTIDVSQSPQTVSVTSRLTDDLSGLQTAIVYFYSPSSQQSTYAYFSAYQRISGDPLDGIYQTTVTFPQYSEAGTWHITNAYVVDAVGNSKNYYEADLIALGFPTTLVVEAAVGSVSPTTLAFAGQPLNTASAAQRVQLSNTGNTPMTVNSIAVTGDFSLDSNNCVAAVGPGSYCDVYIVFKPVMLGTRTGTLTFTDNAANSPQVVSLTGTGGAAIGSVAPNPLTFGSQLLRTTSTARSVALTNTGDAQMVVGNVSVTGDFAVTANYCMNGVAPGTQCNVWITFKPVASGQRTGTLTFVTNATNSPHVIDLNGTGTQVKLSAQSIAFPLQLAGTVSKTRQVSLTNIGTSAVSISSVATSGDFVLRTAAVNPCPTNGSLPAGKSCNIVVAFGPTGPNTRTGSLTINDSDPATPHVVNLSGIGTIVKLSVKTLSFPTTVLGYKSAAKQILMTNVGSTLLSISGIAASQDFAQTNSCGPTLAAGVGCAITVTFAPTAINARTGAITITDDGGGSPQIVSLTGTGTQVRLSATSVNFGKIAGGVTATKTVSLTNVGATTLSIANFTIGGANASDFSSPLNPPCGGVVTAGATCSITLRFTPSIIGAETATFWLFDDGGGSPQKVSLTGTGI